VSRRWVGPSAGFALLAAATLGVGCGATETPPEANMLVDAVPAVPEQAAAAAGASVFGRHCAACHDSDGTGGLGPDLTEGPFTRSYDRVRDVVEGGRAPMPAFELVLDPDEVRDVSAYVVQALRVPGGSSSGGQSGGGGSPRAPESPTSSGASASSGPDTFARYCADCHGPDLGGSPLGPPIDAAADDLPASVRNGGDGMPAFRELLPGGQIESLIAYLRSVPAPGASSMPPSDSP
jgi:mono/diheme cytochrome c family protein